MVWLSHKECHNLENKTKVISADLLDFYFDLEDIFIQIDEEKKFGNKKLVKKKVWWTNILFKHFFSILVKNKLL